MCTDIQIPPNPKYAADYVYVSLLNGRLREAEQRQVSRYCTSAARNRFVGFETLETSADSEYTSSISREPEMCTYTAGR